MPDGDTRNFSMANAPRESDGVQLHIRRIPGGQFSEAVLASLQKGDKLDVEIPSGEFYLRTESEKPIVCLATRHRFRSDQIHHRGFDRFAETAAACGFYWGGRRRQDLYLASLRQMVRRAPWLTFTPVLSEPDAGWRGATGLVMKPSARHPRDCRAAGLCLRQSRDDPPAPSAIFKVSAGLPNGRSSPIPLLPSESGSCRNEAASRMRAGVGK